VKKVILGINKRSSKLYPFRFNGRGHGYIKTHEVSIHGSDVSIMNYLGHFGIIVPHIK
jgi:hypothetical protein